MGKGKEELVDRVLLAVTDCLEVGLDLVERRDWGDRVWRLHVNSGGEELDVGLGDEKAGWLLRNAKERGD